MIKILIKKYELVATSKVTLLIDTKEFLVHSIISRSYFIFLSALKVGSIFNKINIILLLTQQMKEIFVNLVIKNFKT